MIRPNIDVILPFRTVDRFLPQAVKSVLSSKSVQARVILIDDRISDTEKLPFDFGTRVLIVRSSKRGYGNAISEGLRQVTTEYFSLMNADDLMHPHKLSIQIAHLKNSRSSLSIGKILKFDESLRIVPSKLGALDKGYDPRALLLGAYGADATWCGRTESFRDWIFSTGLATDWITAIEYFPTITICYSPRAIYFYRQHKNQLTRSIEYRVKSFNEIYPSWKILNAKYLLPSLDLQSSKLICAPWAIDGIPSKESILRAIEWIDSFNNEKIFTLQSILNRRYLFLFIILMRKRQMGFGIFLRSIRGLLSYLFDMIMVPVETIRFRRFLTHK